MLLFLYQFGTWYNDCLDLYPLATKAVTTAAIGLLGDASAQFHEEQLRGLKAVATAGRRGEEGKEKEKRGSTTETPGSSHFNNSIKYNYNTRRGLANVANNIFLTAPIYHYGYEWLENLIPVFGNDDDGDYKEGGSSLAALCQVFVDCVLFDAIFVLLMFLSSRVIEGYNTRSSSTTRCNDSSNDTTSSSVVGTSSTTIIQGIRTNLIPAIAASWKINLIMIPIEFILFRYFPLRLRTLGMNMIDLVWEAVVSFMIHEEHESGDDGSTNRVSLEEEITTLGSLTSILSSIPSLSPTNRESSDASGGAEGRGGANKQKQN